MSIPQPPIKPAALVSETSPLLPRPVSATLTESHDKKIRGQSIVIRVLFTAFLVAVSFSITQVPIVYVFGVFACDEYYKTHDDPGNLANRCRIPAIEAEAARQVAIVGMGTTFFGVFNLFVTGWSIKRFGLKTALATSVLWPAVRLLVQNVGVQVGAGMGILIIQLSQIITIVGGPVGYLLALNSFAAEVVEPAERTGMLGRVSGSAMFGTSLGFLVGGYLSDVFGIAAPFRVTAALFFVSFAYIMVFLPKLPTAHLSPANAAKVSSFAAFIAPLRLYTPTKWIRQDGRISTEYGVLLLGSGVFLGVLATGFQATLLQLYATDVLDFGTAENGWLISLTTGVRGCFLTFLFPSIIAGGRKWLDRNRENKIEDENNADAPIPDTHTNLIEPIQTSIEGGETASVKSNKSSSAPSSTLEDSSSPSVGHRKATTEEAKPESYRFDLHFTTYSILLDGVLTGLATLVTSGWQLYLLAAVLPFASGTGPAAKGTILQMCSPSQRADALGAISLVELVAQLSTIGLFGAVFAAFASIGRPELTFLCNAAVAMVAFVVLVFARFPPDGSRRVVEVQVEEQSTRAQE